VFVYLSSSCTMIHPKETKRLCEMEQPFPLIPSSENQNGRGANSPSMSVVALCLTLGSSVFHCNSSSQRNCVVIKTLHFLKLCPGPQRLCSADCAEECTNIRNLCYLPQLLSDMEQAKYQTTQRSMSQHEV